MVTKDKLSELLHQGEVTVTFFKKSDGSKRVMRCTLSGELIPTDKKPKSAVAEARLPHPTNMRVYDLHVNGWRSFDYETVTDVNVDAIQTVDPLTASVGAVVLTAMVMSLVM